MSVGEQQVDTVVFAVCHCVAVRRILKKSAQTYVSVHQVAILSFGSVLQCDAVCCSVMQCGTVCGSVLQCVAVCCSVLQCVAVCCSVLQCAAVWHVLQVGAQMSVSKQQVQGGEDLQDAIYCRSLSPKEPSII